MSLPLVSVVMPVYNGEKYLKEAIESILSQTYENLELVVVNDGSTDSSKNIVLSYTDRRIRLVENERNSGIVFTRNQGLESANGIYIATLDCDDVALKDRIQNQVDFLEKNPDYGMCGTFYQIIDANGKAGKKVLFPSSNRDIISFLKIGNCFCNSTILIRSALAKELKYKAQYDIVEDYELWCRMSKRAKMANLPIFSTHYRVHGNNISVSKMNDLFTRVRKINMQSLADSDIQYSESEINIHANLLNGNFTFFNDAEHFNGLEQWILKFYTKLESEKKYNNSLLLALLFEKWQIIVARRKNYQKLFKNSLIALNRFLYIKTLAGRAYDKLMRIK